MDYASFLVDRPFEFGRNTEETFERDLSILRSMPAPFGIVDGATIDFMKGRMINGFTFNLRRHSIGKLGMGFHLGGNPNMNPGHDLIFVGVDRFWWDLRPKKFPGSETNEYALRVFTSLGGYSAILETPEWGRECITFYARLKEKHGYWFHPKSAYHQIGFGPMHVWSDLFCRRAFGKSSLEIAERVRPVAKAVHLDEAGNVQVAFLDMDADVAQILAMNERVRPLIGGYGMFAPFPDDCSGIEGVVTHAPDEKPKPRQEAIMADSELDSMAQAYLDSLQHGCDIEGGVLDGEALTRLTLDYSLDSLDRIDDLLIRIAASRKTAELDVARSEVQNLSFLVGFYAGATLAKARETRPTWKLHAEVAQADPAFAQQVPLAFETYLVCCIGADRFFPLVAVRHLLERGAASPKRLRSSVEAFL